MSRTSLVADTTWEIATTGNDSTGDGSHALPWLTAQYAIEKIQRDYDMAGFIPTLKINDGSWSVPGGLNTFCSGNGPCVGANGPAVAFNIIGNQANPGNCIINLTAGQYGFAVGNHFVGAIYGFKFSCPTSVAGAVPMFASNYGAADFGDVIFTTNYQSINCFALGLGSLLMYGTNNSLLGNCAIMFAAQGGGQLKAATNIDVPSALAFTQFAQANNQGLMDLTHMTYTGAGVSGCTGQRGNASQGSTITVNGNFNVGLGNSGAAYWVKDSTSAIA